LAIRTGAGKTLPMLTSILMMEGEGQALVIPPLLTIQYQLEDQCKKIGVPYLNLSTVKKTNIRSEIAATGAKIVIASIENIADVEVQKQLACCKFRYIAIDEAQVMDPIGGWTQFREYSESTFAYLQAHFKSSFVLASATLEEDGLQRISDMLHMTRESWKVLWTDANRPNIFQQRRNSPVRLDAGEI